MSSQLVKRRDASRRCAACRLRRNKLTLSLLTDSPVHARFTYSDRRRLITQSPGTQTHRGPVRAAQPQVRSSPRPIENINSGQLYLPVQLSRVKKVLDGI